MERELVALETKMVQASKEAREDVARAVSDTSELARDQLAGLQSELSALQVQNEEMKAVVDRALKAKRTAERELENVSLNLSRPDNAPRCCR